MSVIFGLMTLDLGPLTAPEEAVSFGVWTHRKTIPASSTTATRATHATAMYGAAVRIVRRLVRLFDRTSLEAM